MSDATFFLQTFLRDAFEPARRLLFPALLVLVALPAQAESVEVSSLEARVDRLLWQLVNDERYGHLQVAANYERLRARLLEDSCLISSTPWAPDDRLVHEGLPGMLSPVETPEAARLRGNQVIDEAEQAGAALLH